MVDTNDSIMPALYT